LSGRVIHEIDEWKVEIWMAGRKAKNAVDFATLEKPPHRKHLDEVGISPWESRFPRVGTRVLLPWVRSISETQFDISRWWYGPLMFPAIIEVRFAQGGKRLQITRIQPATWDALTNMITIKRTEDAQVFWGIFITLWKSYSLEAQTFWTGLLARWRFGISSWRRITDPLWIFLQRLHFQAATKRL